MKNLNLFGVGTGIWWKKNMVLNRRELKRMVDFSGINNV